MACNSKTSAVIEKRSEIRNSMVVVTCKWGTFDLLVFKVIQGSFGALISIYNSETASPRAKRSGIWDYWVIVVLYGVPFTF